jgi:hypothetical protein
MQKSLPLLMLSFSCFALGSCKDVPLGADGVGGRGGSGGAAGAGGTTNSAAGTTIIGGTTSSVTGATSAGGMTTTGGTTPVGGAAATNLTGNVALQQLLASWYVTEVRVRGDEIWFNLTAPCPECPVDPWRSDLPEKHMLVVVNSEGIKSFVMGGENGVSGLTVDSQQRVFAVRSGPDVVAGVVELSSLPTGTQSLQDLPLCSNQAAGSLTIDSEGNTWTVDYQGLRKWNGTTSILYDTSNSILPTTEISGMAVDKHGTIWVGLGLTPDSGKPTGLMKIVGDKWQYIPYSSISVLASADHATVECVDKDNNLWVSPYNWGNGPPMVRYDGTSWTAEDAYTIHCDSSGTAWNVKESFNNTTGGPSAFDVTNTVAYWDHGAWRSVDVSGITWGILSLDVYRSTLILGTLKGVAFVDGIGTGGTGGTSGTGGTTGTGGASGGTTGANGGTTSSPDAGIANSCENPLPLQCGDQLNHSTLIQGRPNVWSGYNRTQRLESGPEAIYLLQTTAACQVVAQLKNLTVDLDLFRMSSCQQGADTVASSTSLDIQPIETVRFATQPGQPNFVVVDGANGAAGSYTLQVDCTCDQDAGTIDAPPADTQGDTGIAPGCDPSAASAALTALSITPVGTPQTLNATLPAVLATDDNWGLKATVCRQAGYDITALAGKTVCLLGQDMTQVCQGIPATAWVVMNNGAVACVYKAVRPGFSLAPGVYAANDANCVQPTIAAGASVLCGQTCTSANGPCCPTTTMMDIAGGCSPKCQRPAITCDGPEDCPNGDVCCSLESTAGGFAGASCVGPAECTAPSRVICHQQADCLSSQQCGVPNPMPAYVPAFPYPVSVNWSVFYQVCAP